MAARGKNLHLWEAGGQPFGQNGAHHLLGRIVPRVNQIDPQGFGVQEAIILHVGGDKGVAPQGQGIPQQVGASAAPHGHPAHRAAGVHVAHAVGPSASLTKAAKAGHTWPVVLPTGRCRRDAGAIHPVLMELLNLHQSQLLGQGVIDPRHRVQVGMGADGGDPVSASASRTRPSGSPSVTDLAGRKITGWWDTISSAPSSAASSATSSVTSRETRIFDTVCSPRPTRKPALSNSICRETGPVRPDIDKSLTVAMTATSFMSNSP